MAVRGTHFDLKIFVDKSRGNVVFAEADGDFVEVLFSFLTLPLGTIARLIGKKQSEPASNVRCFSSLCQSMTGLGNEHFRSKVFKHLLLHPRSCYEDMHQRLKINIDDTEAKYYLCASNSCRVHNTMSLYQSTKCSYCGHFMTVVKKLDAPKGMVLFRKGLKFIVRDNLQVTPVVPGTFIGHLNNLGTNVLKMIEERTVKLGLNELIELLKCTLLSTTPLTDLFGAKTKLPLSSVPEKVPMQKKPSGEGRKINVKVVLNKSSKALLYVEAGGDFIDFLFNLFFIPLGELLHIMEGKSCVGSLDGLYNSVVSLDSKHFSSEDRKNILLRPKLPPHYIWKNHLFPQESAPIKCTIDGVERTMPKNIRLVGEFGSGAFVREEAVFIVLDNLTVKPFSAAEVISIINRHEISVSGLEERTLSLGMAEGISILRASLNSTSAISNGLLDDTPVLKKPKQEK